MENARTDVNGVKQDGASYTSQNGYHYTKRDGKFELTHRLIMEQKLGRKLVPGERVGFKDKDRTNLNRDNIYILNKQEPSTKKQLAELYAKRDDIQAMIDDLEQQLEDPIANQLKDIPLRPEAVGVTFPAPVRNLPGEQKAKEAQAQRLSKD